jgi:hypothetical protein
MRNVWQIQDFSSTFIVFRWRPLSSEEQALEYRPSAAIIRRWLEDMSTRRAALEMYETAYGNAMRGTVGFDQLQLVNQIEEAFRRRILVCLRMQRDTYSAKSEQGEESPKPTAPPPSQPTKKRDWIAVELVDDKGKPIANERFRIQLPDGSYEEGHLDVGGQVRVDDIDSGTCQVTFPDMDGREWKSA